MPVLKGGTGGAHKPALSISSPTSSPSPAPLSCSVPLNVTNNPLVIDAGKLEVEGGGCYLYFGCVHPQNTARGLHSPGSLYMGPSISFCATSSPLRGPGKPGKPGGKTSSETPQQSPGTALQRSPRQQARGPSGIGLVGLRGLSLCLQGLRKNASCSKTLGHPILFAK